MKETISGVATIIGLTGFQHRELALGDLLVEQPMYGMLGIGNVAMVDLPAGPDGDVRTCVRCALWLVEEAGQRSAMLLSPTPEHGMGDGGIRIEIVSAGAAQASTTLAELRRLTLEHNVYRGHVVGVGSEMFNHQTSLSFLRRPHLAEGEVVLPEGVLELVERQVPRRTGRRRRIPGEQEILEDRWGRLAERFRWLAYADPLQPGGGNLSERGRAHPAGADIVAPFP